MLGKIKASMLSEVKSNKDFLQKKCQVLILL